MQESRKEAKLNLSTMLQFIAVTHVQNNEYKYMWRMATWLKRNPAVNVVETVNRAVFAGDCLNVGSNFI